MAKALARIAISRPISPRPMMPMVAPFSARVPPRRTKLPPGVWRRSNGRYAPCLALMRSTVTTPSSSSSLRASISISPKACSAQEMLARRRSVRSFTPLAAQAAASMLRRPRPNFCSTLRRGAAARSSGRRETIPRPAPRSLSGWPASPLRMATSRTSAGIKAARSLPHPRAPAGEIRLVGGHEIGEGRAPFLARVRVEHERDQPRERIVLDDDDRSCGHC